MNQDIPELPAPFFVYQKREYRPRYGKTYWYWHLGFWNPKKKKMEFIYIGPSPNNQYSRFILSREEALEKAWMLLQDHGLVKDIDRIMQQMREMEDNGEDES